MEHTQRHYDADLICGFALLGVILFHVTIEWMEVVPIGEDVWQGLYKWRVLTCFSVPLFVLASGMFLLDPSKVYTTGQFIRRYILRLVIPFGLWGSFYQGFHLVLEGHFTMERWMEGILGFLQGDMEPHLWWILMLLGLYLVTPLLRVFVKGAKRKDYHYFFLLYLLFVLICPISIQMDTQGVFTHYMNHLHLNFAQFYPPIGYVGLYIGGYYLKKFQIHPLAQLILYLCGIASAMVLLQGEHSGATGATGEDSMLFTGYLSPLVVLMSVGFFLLCRYVLSVGRVGQWLTPIGRLAPYSYGVYLVHRTFILLLTHLGYAQPALPVLIGVPLVALTVCLPSLGIAWMIRKIPWVHRYLG